MKPGTEHKVGRATPQTWEQIRDSYVRGEGSLRRLADRDGMVLSTVEARCRREKWVALREKRKEASLEKLVGISPGNAVVGAVNEGDWWKEKDREHLQQNLELTRRLRQAVDRKIGDATATELERLGGALEAVVKAERELLELTPRSPKNKGPSLRPRKPEYGSREWQRLCEPLPYVPAQPVADNQPKPQS